MVLFNSNKPYPNDQIDNNKTVWIFFEYSYIFKLVNKNGISVIKYQNFKKIIDVKNKKIWKRMFSYSYKTSPNKKNKQI